MKTYFLPVVENDVIPAEVYPIGSVEVYVDCRLNFTMDLVAPPQHQDRCDRRMVADLLCIKGTPSNKTLKGFPQNRVEGLLDV